MAGHGGRRPGAGRPKKLRTPAAGSVDVPIFETAEDYLTAVVAGTVAADPARIAAAKTLIAYQAAKQRTPKRSRTPRQLEADERRLAEDAVISEFEKKAAEIRRRHKEKVPMSEVNIIPMPQSYRNIPMRLRPGIPPIFTDGDPSESDRQLARQLFCLLDEESKAWYRRGGARNLFEGLE